MKRANLIAVLAVAAPLLVANVPLGCSTKSSGASSPDAGSGYVFRDPQSCRPCHEQHVADWEGSMHSYAVKDPIFQALANVQASDFVGEGGQFCTECHTVPGFLQNETPILKGPGGQMIQKTTGLSVAASAGVPCDVCHSATQVLKSQNAELLFEPNGRVHGPFANAQPSDFHEAVGSPLHTTGDLCAACHNVKLPFNFKDVPLESTGLEWNEWRSMGGDKQCQDCHMPLRGTGPVVDGGPDRPLHAHTFVGVDIALIDHPDKDRQLTLVKALLAASVELSVVLATDAGGKTTGFRASLKNLAGHSVPSGVSSERRMWLEATLKDAGGTVAYQTGMLGADGNLMDGYPEHSTTPKGDPDLWWFGGLVTNPGSPQTNHIVAFPHQADGVIEQLLKPMATATKDFAFPMLAPGAYTLTVRVLFRSVQPYFMHALEIHPVAKLDPILKTRVPILPMAEKTSMFVLP